MSTAIYSDNNSVAGKCLCLSYACIEFVPVGGFASWRRWRRDGIDCLT